MTQRYIVGDVVMYNNEVQTIVDNYVSNTYELDSIYYPVNWNELSGVPITPEILEKNGWKKQNKVPVNCTILYNLHNEITIGYNINSKTFIYDFGVNLQRKIKFIHQLQHLLFGLGINHEMEVQVWKQ